MNLGSINENDFKESKAVAIAKNIIEENRCFKTFLAQSQILWDLGFRS